MCKSLNEVNKINKKKNKKKMVEEATEETGRGERVGLCVSKKKLSPVEEPSEGWVKSVRRVTPLRPVRISVGTGHCTTPTTELAILPQVSSRLARPAYILHCRDSASRAPR